MKDPTILFAARCAFYGAVGVSVLLNFVVKGMVTSANDSTRIWVPPPQTGFMPDPNAQLQETTFVPHVCVLCYELSTACGVFGCWCR